MPSSINHLSYLNDAITEVSINEEFEMDYNQQMLAKAEYDRMIKSVPPVYEYPRDVVVSSPAANWLRAILVSIVNLVIR